MRRRGLVFAALLAVSCNSILGNGEHYYVSPDDGGDAGTGTTSAGSAGEENSSAGTSAGSGLGGSVSSSGTSGRAGTAGSLPEAGGSSGGTGTSGAAGGTGAVAGSTGGTGAVAGSTGGTGAVADSTGGTGAVAGSTGGTGAVAGSAPVAGSGASAGSAGAPNLLGVVGQWDGALVEYGCGSTSSAYDCSEPTADNCTIATASTAAFVTPASNGVPTAWQMGGALGTSYNVTVRVRGVVEVSWYHGGTRAAGDASVTVVPRNLFQSGGTPLTYADLSNGFDYDSYELDVTPVSGTPDVYFLNSVIASENPHTSLATHHLTFDIDYTATIPVPGGSTVSLKRTDSNCVLVQNCGPTAGTSCLSPRSVSLVGGDPMPTGFVQPFQMPTGRYGQWLYFDVINVTVGP